MSSLGLIPEEVDDNHAYVIEYLAYAAGKGSGNAGTSGSGKKGVTFKKKSDSKKKLEGKSGSGAS